MSTVTIAHGTLQLVAPHGGLKVDTSTDYLLLLVTFLIGVVAPIITGVFVMRGTRESVAAQRAQLELSIGREDERLRERALLDRGEADRVELRTTIDSLAEHLGAMANALSVAVLWVGFAQTADDHSDPHQDLDTSALEQFTIMWTERNAAGAELARVRLRLDDEAKRMDELAGKMFRESAEAVVLYRRGLTPERSVEIMERGPIVEELYKDFVKEARQFTKAHLHVPLLESRQEPTPTDDKVR